MSIPYVGGKTKYAKDIIEVILPGNEHRVYWEPFVGSGAFLINVPQSMSRFANDKNPYLIALHEAIRDGWQPPASVTEKEYGDIKTSPHKYPKQLVGFVSIGCSFGAKMWGGFARNAKGRNYAAQSSRACLDTFAPFQRVSFMSMDYKELIIPDGALVYCDPPYIGTTDYGDYKMNGSGEFWKWCNELVSRNCEVFVSGYKENKSCGWEVAWSTDVKTVINNSNGSVAKWKKTRVECLFRPMQKHIEHLKLGQGIGACGCWKTAEDLEKERLAA